MTLIDRIKGAFSRNDRQQGDLIERAVDGPLGSRSGLYQNQAGPRKGSEEILGMYRESPRLRGVTHKIASGVAKTEWKLYARKASGTAGKNVSYVLDSELALMPQERRHLAVKAAVENGELDEIKVHPALRVLNFPNRSMSGFGARFITQAHLDLVGNAFWIVDENEAGMPIRLWPIPPSWVTRLPTTDSLEYHVTFAGFIGAVPMRNMIWFKDIDPAEPYGLGSGLGLTLADELDIDEHAAKSVASWFQNNGMPSMLVSMKGASQASVERARMKWDRTLKGFRKAYQTYFTGAEIDVQRLDTTFKDMALVDIRKESRDTVNQTYGMPPEKMGIIENSNKATSQAADLIFTKDLVLPRLEMMRNELQNKFIPRFDQRLIIDFVNPVPEDQETKNVVAIAMPQIFTVNEHRARAGMPPLNDGSGTGFLVNNVWVPSLLWLKKQPDAVALLSAGKSIMTNNEARELLGLPATDEFWGELRISSDKDPIRLLPSKSAPAQLPAAQKKWISVKQARSIVDSIGEATFERSAFMSLIDSLAKAWASDIRSKMKRANGDPLEADLLECADLDFEAVLADANKHLEMIDETTKKEIREVLEEYDGEGDLAGEVKKVFGRAKTSRTQLIATHEALHAGQKSAQLAMKELVEMKEWLAVMDGRTREAHRALDGQKIPVDVPFVVPSGEFEGYQTDAPGNFGEPALDFNCILPGNRVEGSFSTSVISKYVGDAVEVKTGNGRVLRVTANHPVLTPHGWVRAGNLRKGDKVISHVDNAERWSAGSSETNNVDHMPVEIEKVARAIGRLYKSVACRVTGPDLHGDGASIDGDVNIASSDSLLLSRIEASGGKRNGNGDLIPTEMRDSFLASNGARPDLSIAGSFDFSGSPSAGKLSSDGAVGLKNKRPLEFLRFGSSARLDAVVAQSFDNRSSADAELVGKLLDAGSGVVSTDEVIDVERFKFAGHVFDLSSSTGMLVAEGIVISNCRCFSVPFFEEEEDTEDKSAQDARRRTAWEHEDAKLRKWEAILSDAAVSMFEKQEQAVLDAIKETLGN